jgi:hypothetical protein
MGTRQLRILPYTGKRAYQYYIDGLKVNAKRQRLFFKDEKFAKTKLKELTKKTRKEGEDALALSHDFWVLAAKCSERLKPFSKTIWDATEFYLEHLERTKDSVFVSVAAADFQESKKRAKLSATHLDDIRLRLGRFVTAFGKQTNQRHGGQRPGVTSVRRITNSRGAAPGMVGRRSRPRNRHRSGS